MSSVVDSEPEQWSPDEHDRRDVHRRIRNILNVCPATSWSLQESRAVLGILSGIIGDREAAGDFAHRGSLGPPRQWH